MSFAHDTAALKRTQSRRFAQITTEGDDVDFRSDEGAGWFWFLRGDFYAGSAHPS